MSKDLKKFLYLDEQTLVYLESKNLTYKQMIPYFDIIVNENELSKRFKKFGIKHKTYIDKLYLDIKNSTFSISKLCSIYDVSKSTICRIKRKIREEL